MSGRLVTAVLESALRPSLKPTATTLASLARDDGTRLFPSVAYLAWLRGKSARVIQQDLAALRTARVLVVERPAAPDRPTVYRFDASALPVRGSWNALQPPLPFVARDGMALDPVDIDPGVHVSVERVQVSVEEAQSTAPLGVQVSVEETRPTAPLPVDPEEFSTGTNRHAQTENRTGGVQLSVEETRPTAPDPYGSVRDPVRTKTCATRADGTPKTTTTTQPTLGPMDVSAPEAPRIDFAQLREQLKAPLAKPRRRRFG